MFWKKVVLVPFVFVLISCAYSRNGKELIKISDKYTADIIEKVQMASCMVIYSNKHIKGGGSGFFISEDGYLITNYHVVEFYLNEANNKEKGSLTVSIFNGKDYEARVAGWDPYLDIALLKIDADPRERFSHLTFGDYYKVKAGNTVFAVGNPYMFRNSVSKGIVSNSKFTNNTFIKNNFNPFFMQFDAVQGNGSSGGPIVNINGEVIAVSNMIVFVGGGSFGFGIPVNFVALILNRLYKGGEVSRGSLGINVIGVEGDGIRV